MLSPLHNIADEGYHGVLFTQAQQMWEVWTIF